MGLGPRPLRRMEKKQKRYLGLALWNRRGHTECEVMSQSASLFGLKHPIGPILLGINLAEVLTRRLCSVQPSPPL